MKFRSSLCVNAWTRNQSFVGKNLALKQLSPTVATLASCLVTHVTACRYDRFSKGCYLELWSWPLFRVCISIAIDRLP